MKSLDNTDDVYYLPSLSIVLGSFIEMKNIITTTAALAVSTTLVNAAEITTSGHANIAIDNGPADYDLRLSKELVTDSGSVLGGELRFAPSGDESGPSVLPHVSFENGAGKLTIGNHEGPATTMSVSDDMELVNGASTQRIIYHTPTMGGFQISGSAGSNSEVQYGATYTVPMGLTTLTLAHTRSKMDGTAAAPTGTTTKESGVRFTLGGFTASFATFSKFEGDAIPSSFTPGYRIERYRIGESYVLEQPRIVDADLLRTFDEHCLSTFLGNSGNGAYVYYLGSFRRCRPEISEMTGWREGHVYNFGEHERDFPILSLKNPDGSYTDWTIIGPPSGDEQLVMMPPGNEWQQTAGVGRLEVEEAADVFIPSRDRTTNGQEIALSYQISNAWAVSTSKMKTDQDYSRLTVGATYQISESMSVMLSRSGVNDNGIRESLVKARLKYSF